MQPVRKFPGNISCFAPKSINSYTQLKKKKVNMYVWISLLKVNTTSKNELINLGYGKANLRLKNKNSIKMIKINIHFKTLK